MKNMAATASRTSVLHFKATEKVLIINLFFKVQIYIKFQKHTQTHEKLFIKR